MSVLDDCDVEYSVDYSAWNSNFHERETERKKTTWSLHVARKLVVSSKTLRILRKYGVISRRERLWAFIISPVFSLATCVMSAITGFGLILFASLIATVQMVQMWATFGSLFFIGIMLLSLKIIDTDERFLKKIANRIDKDFNKNSRGRIEIDRSEKEIYDFVKTLSMSKDENAMKLKKTLFELVTQYPDEVNEQINELYKMKEEISEDAEGSQVVIDDVDQMLEKLFRMRDTSENLQIVSQVMHVLKEAIRQEKTEQMGISVEKLSEIADFLSKAEQEKKIPEPTRNNEEVSALVSEMNNVDVEYETVEKDTRRTEVKHLV